MLKLTLTRNRSTPERYLRYVTYQRGADGRVTPIGHNRGRSVPLAWFILRSVTEPKVDREFAEAWCAHVDAQAIKSVDESPCITREQLVKAGLLKPADAPKWKRDLKAVIASVTA